MKTFALAFLCVVLAAPAWSGERVQELPGVQAVILSAEDVRGWYGDFDAWTPTVEDALKVDEAVIEYLRMNSLEAAPDLIDRIPAYNRQYEGLADGEKRLIHVNLFCIDVPLERMISQPFIVRNGGDCFVDAIYDVAADEIIEFFVHREDDLLDGEDVRSPDETEGVSSDGDELPTEGDNE